MKMKVLSAALALCCSTSVFAEEWGSVTGQVVVTGAIPDPVLLHAKGAPIKDANVCAAQDTYKEDLVIDKASKGLANVIIYLPKAPKSIHPDLKTAKPTTLTFDQKGCQFIPHAMVVRSGETVEVISSDPIAHNTHTYPLKNQPINVLIAPNTSKGKGEKVDYKTGELLPLKVTCDFHPWMSSYWMVVDHPYAVVTDKEGKFALPNLPVGEHEFRVWHERPGYIEKKYKIVVKSGENVLKPLEVKADSLKEK